MTKCWDDKPRERPTFSLLVKKINDILVPLAGYLDTSAAVLHSNTNYTYVLPNELK